MTLQTLKVLKVLLSDSRAEHYGLEIARLAGLKTGTIYPILARLEASGWVVSEWESIDPVAAGRRPRRYYRLSTGGAERARQQLQETQWIGSPVPNRSPSLPAPGIPQPDASRA